MPEMVVLEKQGRLDSSRVAVVAIAVIWRAMAATELEAATAVLAAAAREVVPQAWSTKERNRRLTRSPKQRFGSEIREVLVPVLPRTQALKDLLNRQSKFRRLSLLSLSA